MKHIWKSWFEDKKSTVCGEDRELYGEPPCAERCDVDSFYDVFSFCDVFKGEKAMTNEEMLVCIKQAIDQKQVKIYKIEAKLKTKSKGVLRKILAGKCQKHVLDVYNAIRELNRQGEKTAEKELATRRDIILKRLDAISVVKACLYDIGAELLTELNNIQEMLPANTKEGEYHDDR